MFKFPDISKCVPLFKGEVISIKQKRVGNLKYAIDGKSVYINTIDSGSIDTVLTSWELDLLIAQLKTIRKQMLPAVSDKVPAIYRRFKKYPCK